MCVAVPHRIFLYISWIKSKYQKSSHRHENVIESKMLGVRTFKFCMELVFLLFFIIWGIFGRGKPSEIQNLFYKITKIRLYKSFLMIRS